MTFGEHMLLTLAFFGLVVETFLGRKKRMLGLVSSIDACGRRSTMKVLGCLTPC
jgi:hypothetical protein